MSTTFENDDVDQEFKAIEEDRRRINQRYAEVRLKGGNLTAADQAQMAEVQARSAAYIARLKQEGAGLRRAAAAMRPGETMKDLIEWGKSKGLTTFPEIFAARESETQ